MFLALMSMKALERGTVVVLTHNHKARLLQTLRALQALPEGWPIIVVDNGSSDGTSKAVGRDFPSVMLIRSRRNLGAAARNIAVAYVHTPYVAFTDDDVIWQPGALQKALSIMDANPHVAAVSGCVRQAVPGRFHVGGDDARRQDDSFMDDPRYPNPLSLRSEACVLRTRAFYDAGGYWPPMFDNGEILLSLDMADRGWHMLYSDDVVSWKTSTNAQESNTTMRRRLRNTIWTAWMRLPFHLAWAETVMQLRKAARVNQLKPVLVSVLAGLGNALQHRRVVSPDVADLWSARYRYAVAYRDELKPASRESVV